MDGQRGFTLTELMVAIVMGTVIILGAGQLFLSTIQTFRHVDVLSRQQETLIFVVTTIAATLRNEGAVNDAGEPFYRLQCIVLTNECRCTVQDTQRSQPLVSFATGKSGSCERDNALGLPESPNDATSVVTLPLGTAGRDIRFHVAHRQQVLDQAH